MPTPLLLGARAAAQTTRLRIGQAGSVVTQWHPLRLAEDLAILDHMSNGRLDVGFGRGYAYEAMTFNINADVRDQERNRALFEETVEVVKNAWTGDILRHKGEFYEFPVPGINLTSLVGVPPEVADPKTGELIGLAVRPQPLQKPMPPIWQTVDSERSIAWAAQNDVNAMIWLPPVEAVARKFKIYQDAAIAAGKNLRLGERMALMRSAYVAPTAAEAREDFEKPLLDSYRWLLGKRGLSNLARPGEEFSKDTELTYDFVNSRSLLVGEPSYVIDKIHELKEKAGLEHLIIWSSQFGLPHEKTMRSLELFAEHIIPAFPD
jgi:alkanesulfonate monooxygenase SsuD/methylene tetrahydromethanopterin reductase-like flavin-dependent oxidoreductase (luciferase family)